MQPSSWGLANAMPIALRQNFKPLAQQAWPTEIVAVNPLMPSLIISVRKWCSSLKLNTGGAITLS
ncbi:hypothetical protein MOMUL_30710 [Moorella mulderi DSM 14980]|uniref:Uncharacterized protein n=1 Tax=Moorella mulderi DSM 14980 TaxID=1122241 RepID=A0A151AS53_9FIRM|nr:hypothetical protein MOMUL_30710 [Moorella mulderi DSM 14980]